MTTRNVSGSASQRVKGLVERAREGGLWYDVDGTSVSFVEPDPEKWWAGTVYEVAFRLANSGYSSSEAATFVLDIAADESISPASSSPWNGWVGWSGNDLTIAWQNSEIGAKGTSRLSRPFEVDDEPTDEQLAGLARLIVATCFSSEK